MTPAQKKALEFLATSPAVAGSRTDFDASPPTVSERTLESLERQGLVYPYRVQEPGEPCPTCGYSQGVREQQRWRAVSLGTH